MDLPVALGKKVAWFTLLALLATGWVVFVDHALPAHSAPTVCSTENPCEYPKASKGKFEQFQDGKIGRTSTKSIRSILDKDSKRKLKKAYRLYVIDQEQDPAPSARKIEWPSPKAWLRGVTENIKCATVGASKTHWATACAGGPASDWYEKVNMAINEAARVSVKCGGAAVLGGLTKDGKDNIRKAFGVGVRGGWGMAAFGGACLWNEYYDRYQPW